MMKKKHRHLIRRPVPEEQCTIRVVQIKRGPGLSPSGIRRRPRVINEVVSKWYHRCQWCNEWFVPERANQRYCDFRCRHSSFRERARVELEDLRRGAGR
jgi:hypothetical protein